MRVRLARLLLATGLALTLAPSAADADQSVTIGESEYKLDPASVDASAGQVVHFTIKNNGSIEHNFKVELPSANIEQTLFPTNLKPGETRTVDFTFAQAGAWEMYCPVDGHEDLGMKGDIEVKAAAAAPAAPAVPATPATAGLPPAPTPVRATTVAAPAQASAPVAQAAPPTSGPVALPAQLPRTGGLPLAPFALALGGLSVLAGGLLARRRR